MDRCRSGHDCVGYTSDGAALTTRPLCEGCIVSIQQQLDALPHLRKILSLFKGGGLKAKGTDVRVQGSREPAAPLDVNIVVLIEEIDDTIALVDGCQIRDLITQGPVDYNLWNKGQLVYTTLEGIDRALRVRRTYRQASKVVGLDPVWTKRAAPCPQCHQSMLGQWTGTDVVDCRYCGAKLSQSEYEQYVWDAMG